MAHVDFEQVDKIYPGGTQAIFDFSLVIADGEALALVGPSGCGKSTLLRLLQGVICWRGWRWAFGPGICCTGRLTAINLKK